MQRQTQFTERDLTILRALCAAVRVFGLRQLADTFWNGDVANARRRLQRFVGLGLVERILVPARPLPEMLGPVVACQPDGDSPDVKSLAFKLQCRWRFRAVRPTVVYIPTRALIDHFGARHRNPLSSQVSHDLGVAEVWLWMLKHRPDDARRWQGEDSLTDEMTDQAKPDAVLIGDSDGMPETWIEFGGDYDAERVQAFHDAAIRRQVNYQIW